MKLTQHLDPESDRAVFRQIADHLREMISSGKIPSGQKVPSEAKLMEHYGVTRMTIRHALDVLKAEGLVYAEHGKGVFVRSFAPVRRLASDRFLRSHRATGRAAFEVEAAARGSVSTVDSLVVSEAAPPADIATRLQLDDQPAIIRSRRYLLDGHPVETAVSYLPASIARGTAIAESNPGSGGIYARLEDLGFQLAYFDEEIRARMPSAGERSALRLTVGVPVFHLVRTAFATNERPVEVCVTVMSSEAYVLDYKLPAH